MTIHRLTLQLLNSASHNLWQSVAAPDGSSGGRRMPTSSGADYLVLEPRIMFDGAMADTIEHAIDHLPTIDQSVDDHSLELLAALAAPLDELPLNASRTVSEIAFIDGGVDDVDGLVAAMGPDVEVHILNPARDGVEQMAEILSSRQDIGAIHILAHGRPGTLELGDTKLTAASIASRHADELAVIKASLAENADILIYGCDFSAGARGHAAVAALAAATGADIAASDDLTGATALGGDWVLEDQTGLIEARTIAAADWQHTLTTLNANALATGTGMNSATVTYTGTDGNIVTLQRTSGGIITAETGLGAGIGRQGTDWQAGDIDTYKLTFATAVGSADVSIGFLNNNIDGEEEVYNIIARDAAGNVLPGAVTFTNLAGGSFAGSNRGNTNSVAATFGSPAGAATAFVIHADAAADIKSIEFTRQTYRTGQTAGSGAFGVVMTNLDYVTAVAVSNTSPIIDLNTDATAADLSRNHAVVFTAGGPPVNLTEALAGVFDGEGDSFQLLTIRPANIANGNDALLYIGNRSFPLATNATVGGITVPGSSVTFDVRFENSLFTIRRSDNGPISEADMEALIRSTKYENTAVTPNTTATRTFDFQVVEYANAFVIDFEEFTPGSDLTPAQIESDPYWGNAAQGNGRANSVDNNPTNPLAQTAKGVYLQHFTNGAVPATDQVVFGRSAIPTVAGTQYTVSVDLGAALSNTNGGPFQLVVNGSVIRTINMADLPVDNWATFTANFTATGATTSFQIRNLSTATVGNDFGIDNISFTPTFPITSNVARTSLTVVAAPASTSPIIDLNTDGGNADLNRDNAVVFTAGGAPINLTTGVAGVFDADPGSSYQLLTIRPANIANGNDARLLIGDKSFQLATDATIGGVTVPGSSATFDIRFVNNLFTIRRNDNGAISEADMEALVRSVRYVNLAANPNLTAVRTFDFQVVEYTNAFVNDFEEFTPGSNLTAAQLESSAYWGDSALGNGLVVNPANNPGNLLAQNAEGNYVQHSTTGSLPGGQEVVFGRSGIPTRVGTQYTVSVDLGALQNNVAGGPFQIVVNGNVLRTINMAELPVNNWATFSVNFTATSTTSTFQIRNLATSATGNDFGIDNVSFASSFPISSNVARTSLTVARAPNDPPVASNDSQVVIENITANGGVLGNDTDPNGDTLTLTTFVLDANGEGTAESFAAGQTADIIGVGKLTMNADGTYIFVPARNYVGVVPVVTYTIIDGKGGTSQATLTLGPILADGDGDGFPDNTDLDSDNDGITNAAEGGATLDTDGDSIANALDLDSDNDGISDLVESGQNASLVDTNNDGIHDGPTNPGGIPLAANGGAGVTPVNTDGDARADYLDLDSDNDGIADTVEARPTAGYVANDGDVRNNDLDGDGVIDLFDSNDATTGVAGGTFSAPVNTDSTDNPDYRDTDSDNDTLLDSAESGLSTVTTDANGDGIRDSVGASYADPDGIVNNPQTALANQFGTNVQVAYRENAVSIDSDGDGAADGLDFDDDNDGILDINEQKITQPTGVDAYFAGAYTLSVDGTFDSSTTANQSVTINKPAGGTVAAVYVMSVDHPDAVGPASDIKVAGIPVTLPNTRTSTTQGANVNINRWGDVTAEMRSLLDGMPTGGNSLTMEEVVPGASNGSIIMVVWNDPAKTNSMVALQFSSLRTSAGTSVSIPTAPINTSAPGFNLRMGLGIGHSTGTAGEVSTVRINGNLVTSTAGGADDGNTLGVGQAGQLITIGDDQDIPGPNSELYDLEALGVVSNGATAINLTTASLHQFDYLSVVWIQADGVQPIRTDVDTDGDGIFDHLDLDSDNDGISDLTESGQNTALVDNNNNGVVDGGVNASGVPLAANGGAGVVPINTDGDARADFLDLDSDNDGIADTVEARPTAGYAPNDGNVTNDDVDGDGVIGLFDTSSGFGGNFTSPINTDGADNADYRDTDSDNDGLLDSAESGLSTVITDANGDGIRDSVGASYADPDGIVNNPQTALANQFGTTTQVAYRENAASIDTDGDGVADVNDIDDDNDGILDTVEGPSIILLSTQNPTSPAFSLAGAAFAPKTGSQSGLGFPTQSAATGSVSFENIRSGSLNGAGGGTIITFSNGQSPGLPNLGVLDINLGNIAESTTATQVVTNSQFNLGDIDSSNFAFEFQAYDSTGALITDPTKFSVSSNAAGGLTRTGPASLGGGTFAYSIQGVSFSSAGVRVEGANGTIISRVRFVFTTQDVSGDNIAYNVNRSLGTLSNADRDGDSIADALDIDSDNDGITDNVEAQATNGYVKPTGIDSDGDGLDNAYDATPTGAASGTASLGLTRVDTDGDLITDVLDANSDNVGLNDIAERGDGQPTTLTSLTDTDLDGLLDIFESGTANDGFDVNDQNIDASGVFALSDTDNDVAANGSDASGITRNLNYRDNHTPVVDLNSAASATDANVDNTVTYPAGGAPVPVAAALASVFTDGEADISRATITLGGALDVANDKITILGTTFALNTSQAQQFGLRRVFYEATTKTFTVTRQGAIGVALVESDINSLLASVAFSNSGAAGIIGSRTLTFTVSDTIGSQSAAATATVLPANTAPTTTGGTVSFTEDNAIFFRAVDFNFADVDPGDVIESVRIVTLPTVGTLTLNGQPVAAGATILKADFPNFRFVPAANANAVNYSSFTYKVGDGDAFSNTATMQILGAPQNDAPVATVKPGNNGTVVVEGQGTPASFGLAEPGTPSEISVADLLAQLQITDVEQTSFGIGVTTADETNGVWQYNRIDIPGHGWVDFQLNDVGNVDATPVPDGQVLLFNSNTVLRFVPKDTFSGGANISFKVWDQTVGEASNPPSTTLNDAGGLPPTATSSLSTTTFTAATATDHDGDGVADTVDLDDDNDGILDTIEGAGTSSSGSGKHIVLLIDESGSIDPTEAAQIRSGLTQFINDQIGSGNTVSFVGMSGGDTNIRTDHVLSVTFPTSGTDNTAAFDTWIAAFKNYSPGSPRGLQLGGADYWASGLQVANTLSLGAGDQVIIVTDGAQGNPATAASRAATLEAAGVHIFALGVDGGNYFATAASPGPHNVDNGVNLVFDNVSGSTGNPVQEVGNYDTDFAISEFDRVADFTNLATALGSLGRVTTTATTTDTDGDGVADQFDLDSDNDGISDLIESGAIYTAVDTGNNGVYDSGVNAQGIPTAANTGLGVTPVNTDGTGPADFRDLDSDDDGIPDAVEARPTAGYTPFTNTNNATNFGVNDTGLFAPSNTDGDATFDFRDTDSDNDAILDKNESGLTPGADANGDGIGDGLGASYSNADGTINTPLTALQNTDSDASNVDYRSLNVATDTDGDGVADSIDIDDDNDGILDTVEGYVEPTAATDTVVVNNGNGQLYRISDLMGTPTTTLLSQPLITMGDVAYAPNGILYGIGFDASGSIYTINETTGATTLVGDLPNLSGGQYNSLSFGPDGKLYAGSVLRDIHRWDPSTGTSTVFYTLPTGVGSGGDFIFLNDKLYMNVRNNGSGVISLIEATLDASNNISSVVDLGPLNPQAFGLAADSQGNLYTLGNDTGIGQELLRITLAGTSFTTTVVTTVAANSFGMTGRFESTVSTSAIDTDNDGIADYLDLDSDNDGITDNVEAQTTAGYILPTGTYNGQGLDNAYVPTNGLTPVNTDGADKVDYLDLNSDNDANSDQAESGLTAASSTLDADGDGLLDAYEGSNVADGFDANDNNLTGTTFNLPDTDNDTAANGAGAVPLVSDLDYRDAPQPPVAVDDGPIAVTENTNATGNVLTNDTDADGGTLTVTQFTVSGVSGTFTAGSTATIPGVGTLVINSNGAFTFAPAANYNGPVPSASYTVSDGTLTDVGILFFSDVVNVNSAPVDGNETNSTPKNTTLTVVDGDTGDLLNNAFDPDGGGVTITGYTVAGVAGTPTIGSAFTIPGLGSLTINDDGSYTFVPVATFTGAVPLITYTVSDGALTDTSTLRLTVVADTDGDGVADTTDIDDDNDGILDVNEVNPAAEVLNPDIGLVPGSFAIAADSSNITAGDPFVVPTLNYTVPAGNDRLVFFVVTFEGTSGGTDTERLNLTGATFGGVPLTLLGSEFVSETGFTGEQTYFYMREADIPAGSNAFAMTLPTITGNEPDLSIAAYTYRGVDQTAAPQLLTATNLAPGTTVAGPTPTSDTLATMFLFGGNLQTATASAGSTLIHSTQVDPQATSGHTQGMTVAAAYANTCGGTPSLQFGAAPNRSITATLMLKCADGMTCVSDSDNDGIYDHLDIDSDNDGITDSVEAQTTAGYIAPSGTGAAMLDADNDGLDDRYDATSAGGASGSLGLTPVNTDGADVVDYLDSDSDNDGTSDAGERGTAGPTTAATGLSTSANDADGDGLFDVFEGASTTDGFDVNDENLTGTTFNLADTDNDTAADGAGAVPLTSDLDYRDNVQANRPPVAVDDGPIAVTEDINATGNVLTGAGADTDPDGNTLTVTQFTVAGVTGTFTAGSTATIPGVGTLVINANGAFTFDPDLNYVGPVPSATYTVSDGTLTDTAVLSFANVTAVNDAPADGDETASTNQDVTLTVPAATGLLANTVDPDGGTPTITGYTIAGVAGTPVVGTAFVIPSVGSITINADGSYTFDPLASFTGAAPVITYTVSDGTATDTSTLSITVNATGDTDGDGVADANDIDDDNDGIIDANEGVTTVSIGGKHIVLVIDESGSIDPTEQAQIRTGLTSFINAQIGSGNTVSFIGMSTQDTNNRTDHVLSVTFPTNGTDVTAAFDTWITGFGQGVGGAYTATAQEDFWSSGLEVANTLGLGTGDQVIIVTDGAQGGVPAPPFFNSYNPASAAAQAVTLETAGVHLFTIGVGPGNYYGTIVNAGDAAARVYDNVSGSTGNAIQEVTDYAVDFATSEYDNVTDFSGLAAALSNLGTATTVVTTDDTDGDGIINSLDIDSDNDGITDNVEAQTTAGYIAPSGTGAAMVDANNDGLDDNYGPAGLTAVNTDGADGADFIDSDSDNDGITDAAERGTAGPTTAATGLSTAANDADGDGLFDVFEGASTNDGFDVNDENLTGTTFNLADTDNDTAANGAGAVPLTSDLDFRDNVTANRPPVAVDDGPIAVTEDTNATGNVLTGTGADTDPDGDTLTVTQFTVAGVTGTFTAGTTATIPGVGTLVIRADGSFTFAPALNYNGPVPSATYTISDGTLTDTGVLLFANVTPVNDAPVDGNETNTVTQNTTLTVANGATGDLLNNATDVDGNPLTIIDYSIAGFATPPTIGVPYTIPGVGDITINANGSYSFVPVTNYTGAIPVFTYTVFDGTTTDTSTLTLTIGSDADGDGVSDKDDIDDDNDGIIDTVESMTPTTSVINVTGDVTASSGTGNHMSVTVNGNSGTLPGTGPSGTGAAPAILTTLDGVLALGAGETLVNQRIVVDIRAFDDGLQLSLDGTQLLFFTQNHTFSVPEFQSGGLFDSNTGSPGFQSYLGEGNPQLVVTNGHIQLLLDTNDGRRIDALPYLATTNVPGFVLNNSFTYDLVTGAHLVVGNANADTQSSVDQLRVTFEADVIKDVDTDADGIVDRLDIDSDNDGITDNVEAQTTAGYIAPSGTGAAMVDANNDGLDDNYGPAGLTPVNTDGADVVDYLDSDSDNDGRSDAAERGTAGPATAATGLSTLTNDADGDGLFDVFEGASTTDGFDVNDENLTGTTFNLADTDNDTGANGSGAAPRAIDLDYRDNAAPPVDGDETNVVTQNTTLTVADGAPGDLLNNATDADGDPLTITGFTVAGVVGTPTIGTAFTIPGVGSITINANGSYSFAPVTNFTGTIPVITYTVSDGTLTDTSTLTLSMTAVNQPPVAVDDGPIAVTEDTAATGNVLTNDTDPENTTLTVTQFTVAGVTGTFTAGSTATIPSVGTLVINADGSFTFTPVLNYNGPVPSATYTVSDGTLTDTGVLSFANVTPVNDAPVDGDETNTVTQNVTLTVADGATGDLLNNATDVDGDVLTITGFTVAGVTGTPTIGTPFTIPGVGDITVNAIGSYSFAPVTNFTGTIPVITYTVSDGTLTDTSTLTLSLTAVNQPPVATDDGPIAVTEDTNATGNVLTNDTDPENTTLTVTEFTVAGVTGTFTAGSTATIPGVGTLVINSDGSFTFDPDLNYVGPVPSATYTVSDGALTDTAVLSFAHVTPVNDAPVDGDETNTVTEDTTLTVADGAAGDLLNNATDIENSPLTISGYAIAGVPGVQTVGTPVTITGVGSITINSNGSYSFTPLPNFDGVIPVITYTVLDGTLTDTSTLTLSMTPVNDPPMIVDPTDPGTPDNPKPAPDPLNIIPDVSADDSDTPPPLNVSDYVVDPEGNPLTFTATGLPPGLSLDPTTGIISGTLPKDASQGGPNGDGIYPVTITIDDGTNPPVTTTVNYTITNPAPVAVDDVKTLNEDTVATGNVLTDAPGSDSDPDGDTLVVTQYTVPGLAGPITAGTPATIPNVGTITIRSDGSYTFTPVANYSGAVPVITYTVSDGEGGTDTATLTLTITTVNDPPVVVDPTDPGTPDNPKPAPDPLNIIPDVTTKDSLTPTSIDVSDYIVDPEGDVLTYTATNLPPGLTLDPVTGVISGTLTPDASQGGPNNDGIYPVTITVTDPSGNTATTTVTYTITNPPPVAVNDTATVTEDTTATGNVLTTAPGTDTDPDGDPLVVTQFDIPGVGVTPAGTPAVIPNVGTLTINPNGSWNFVPAPNYDGPVPIATYSISDGNGGTDTGTLALTITPVNDPPVVIDPTDPGTPENPKPAPDPLNIIPDVSTKDGLTPTPIDVSDYIVDPEGDPLTFTATGLPPGLTIDPVTGIISGTLPKDASQGGPNGDGNYPVTIIVTDPDGGTTTTTVTYSVSNPAPAATDDVNTVTEDVPASGNVLTNDTDPDGDPLRVTSFDVPGLGTITAGSPAVIPNVGTLTINPNGSYTFTPSSNYAGPVPVVTYTISDGEGGTDTATLTLTITPVNDPPVVIDPDNPGTPLNPIEAPDPDNIIPDVVADDSGTPTPIDVSDFIVDPDGNPLTFTATGLPPGLTISPTGVITGTLTPDASQGGPGNDGIYTVTIKADDGNGGTVTTTITYTVSNPPPVATDDVNFGDEDTVISGNVLPNDSDPDGDPLVVLSAAGDPPGTPIKLTYGTLVINADGTYTFTPNAKANALPEGKVVTQKVTYVLSDGNGGTDTAELKITLTGTNDAPIAADLPDRFNFEGDTVKLPIAGNFVDPDGDKLTFTAKGLPPGLTIDPETGIITGKVKPGAAANGPYTVTVTADDGKGGKIAVTFVYEVDVRPAPPVTPPVTPGTPTPPDVPKPSIPPKPVVSEAVDGIDDLGGDFPDFGDTVVKKTVDLLGDLNGTGFEYGGGVIKQLVDWLGRQGREANWLYGRFAEHPYIGDTEDLQLRFDGRDLFTVKSVIYNGALYLGVDEWYDGVKIVAITARNGNPLPDFVTPIDRRSLIANIRPDGKWMEFDVKALMPNGAMANWTITVNPDSSEVICTRSPMAIDQSELAPSLKFTDQVRHYVAAQDTAADSLLDALRL